MSDPETPTSPTVEKVVETKETTKASTEAAAAAVISPAPAIVADDRIRGQLAWLVILEELAVTLGILFGLFHYANSMSKDVLTIIATLCGSIIGYKVKDTGTVINYEFGSSSGSTAKSAMLEQHKP